MNSTITKPGRITGTLKLARQSVVTPTPQPELSKSERRRRDVRALEAELRWLCPKTFGGTPKPLKIGVHDDLAALLANEFDPQIVAAFLARWCNRPSYVAAVVGGAKRIDLDGIEVPE